MPRYLCRLMDNQQWTRMSIVFRNVSAEADTEFCASGFVEDLIADLTRFRSLRVLASQCTCRLSQTESFR